jgi:hypothetical protein
MKSYPSFDAYLADQGAKQQTIIKAIRRFVRGAAPGLTEAVKWGNGCWLGKKEPVAYVYAAPEYVQFGFFRGAALKDPKKLLEGDGKYVRHIKVRSSSAIDPRAFGSLLRQAVRQGQ